MPGNAPEFVLHRARTLTWPPAQGYVQNQTSSRLVYQVGGMGPVHSYGPCCPRVSVTASAVSVCLRGGRKRQGVVRGAPLCSSLFMGPYLVHVLCCARLLLVCCSLVACWRGETSSLSKQTLTHCSVVHCWRMTCQQHDVLCTAPFLKHVQRLASPWPCPAPPDGAAALVMLPRS
jgi:hypothetical protein